MLVLGFLCLAVMFLNFLQVGRIQVIAFQSADSKHRYESPARDTTVVIDTSSSWSSFDNSKSASESAVIECFEQDSADSRMTKVDKVI